jgi:hypothetical protein
VFSELDNIIFPDGCEVIEIVPSQQYVYPIFKCGRSSLTESMQQKGWKFVDEKDISSITQPITVFLRNPRDRFVSGVNTFLQHLDAEGNMLDQHTVLYFVNRYLFLNRHYAPQFFWLLNLMRFSSPNTLVKFQNITEISKFTDVHSYADIEPITPEFRQKIQTFDWDKLELYFYLDQVLLDHLDQTVNLRDLIKHIQTNHSKLYELVFQKTLNIIDVLPKT